MKRGLRRLRLGEVGGLADGPLLGEVAHGAGVEQHDVRLRFSSSTSA
jgi:hypothetical protein